MSAPLFDNVEQIGARIRATEHILLALDFDGTLAPIAENPGGVELPASTSAILSRLSAESGAWIAVVSGRRLADVRRRVGLNIIYAGNHGLEISGPGIQFRHPIAAAAEKSIRGAAQELAIRLARIRGAWVEDKGLTAAVHFRQAAASSFPEIHRICDQVIAGYTNLVLLPAQRAWEVRPRLAWNKGSAALLIAQSLRVLRPLTICIGDDETDEDMFGDSAAISIKVGHSRATRAQYHVENPADVRIFLALVHRWITRTVPTLAYLESRYARYAARGR